MNKTLAEYMSNRLEPIKEERVDEILMTLVAGSVLAYCCKPLMETDAMKSLFGGVGQMFAGIGSIFGFGKKDKDKKDKDDKKETELDKKKREVEMAKLQKELDKLDGKDDEDEVAKKKKELEIKKLQKEIDKLDGKEKDDEKDDETSNQKTLLAADDEKGAKSAATIQALLAWGQDKIEKEKDPDKKAKYLEALNVVKSCTVDKDGKPLTFEEMKKNFQQKVGDMKDFMKKYDIPESNSEEDQKMLDNLKKDLGNMSKEEREDMVKKSLESSKKAANEVEDVDYEDVTDKEEEKEDDKKDKDNDKEEKDEDGNIIKKEEITDPETGKKKKVVTHTGPRGGKFYYPDSKPKTPENKVYVESLVDFLKDKL